LRDGDIKDAMGDGEQCGDPALMTLEDGQRLSFHHLPKENRYRYPIPRLGSAS